MKTKLLAAVAVLFAALICIALWWRDDPATTPVVAAAMQEQPPQPAPSSIEQAPVPATDPTRELVLAPVPVEQPAEAPFDPSPVRVTPWLARFLVLDDDDRPVGGAVVTIWVAKRSKPHPDLLQRLGDEAKRNHYSGHESDPLFELLTDAEGRASVMLDLECLAASAQKEDIKTSETWLWNTRSNAEETKFVLLMPLLLRGSVVRADGSPAAGAKVTPRVNGVSTMQRGRPPQPEPVVADADGRFTIPVVQHAGYNLHAELDGQRSFRERCWVLTRTPPEVVLVFPGAITLNGIVVDADGKPVEKADVRIWREYRRGDPNQEAVDYETSSAKSASDGRFSIAVRQHRRYQLLASADGHATSSAVWVEPTAARPRVEVQLALQRFTTIAGVVRRTDGTPFAGVKVSAQLDDANDGAVAVPSQRDLYQGSAHSVSDDKGRFELTVHPGTDWTIVAWPITDNWHISIVTKEVRPGTKDLAIVVRDEDLQGCVVRGAVVTSHDGKPLTTFEIDLIVFADGKTTGSRTTNAVVHGNRFEMPLLPVGKQFALDVFPTDGSKQNMRPRNPTSFATARVGPFTTTREGIDLNVRVEAWGELPVQVLEADGTPARNVFAMARRDLSVGDRWPQRRRLDPQGKIALTLCVPGPHKLLIFRESEKVHELDVTILPGLNPEMIVRLPAGSAPGKSR